MGTSALFQAIVGQIVEVVDEDETPRLYRRNSELFRVEQLEPELPSPSIKLDDFPLDFQDSVE